MSLFPSVYFASCEVKPAETVRDIDIVMENRVLRRIFGPKRDQVSGEWRKLHNEELNGLYS
jgi:hypothetical protein